ncbi:hypothetical protein LTR53_009931 [Teratosphaeriaceae sp. CCFEE 6253]|nr:hypothetical protein LTR53_009931 [Teratosphaeriaceae sp. CCFEE 6253]
MPTKGTTCAFATWKSRAQPIVGTCGECSKVFCSAHRLPESHLPCLGLARTAFLLRVENAQKLEREATQSASISHLRTSRSSHARSQHLTLNSSIANPSVGGSAGPASRLRTMQPREQQQYPKLPYNATQRLKLEDEYSLSHVAVEVCVNCDLRLHSRTVYKLTDPEPALCSFLPQRSLTRGHAARIGYIAGSRSSLFLKITCWLASHDMDTSIVLGILGLELLHFIYTQVAHHLRTEAVETARLQPSKPVRELRRGRSRSAKKASKA